MKENVIGLTCVLADGRVVTTRHRPRKSAAGYDLTALIIGSEGTLGLVTEAVLRLARVPRNLHVGIATFGAFGDGVGIVVHLQKSGHRLEALELCDAAQMHCLNVSNLSPLHTFPEKHTLFFKIAGPSTHLVAEQIALMKQLCARQNALELEITSEEERMGVLWGARKAMGSALVKTKKRPSDLFIHSDCAVPISNLSTLVSGTQELIGAASPGRQWFYSNTAHIGDGNVHSAIVCPVEDKIAAEGVVREIARLALRLEGTVTGEHGVGMELRDALEEEVGSVGVGVMRDVKRALDGRGIMNPGKVVRLVDEGERRAKL
jgi:D-lactate dehydrogenase (cytochrome)